jgi:hypothetical protein
MRDGGLPRGYTQFTVGKSRVVCAEPFADDFRDALRESTLYEFAAGRAGARSYAGRGASYGIPLPTSGARVVVRHNRHGGTLAPITRDLFVSPTRAPLELEVSERLRLSGIDTPQLVGYVRYPIAAGFERVDVATREVDGSSDLSASLMSADATVRETMLRATSTLIRKLADAGARHHDLNIKNVLLQMRHQQTAPRPFVLDVDRVTFGMERQAALEANLERLIRSARKWQRLHAAPLTDAELDAFASMTRN